jgi:hypothetical protein
MRNPLAALLSPLLLACNVGHAAQALRDGDIIFQTSKSGQSLAIQRATNSPYSHEGLVVFRDAKAFVFEASATVRFSEGVDRPRAPSIATSTCALATSMPTTTEEAETVVGSLVVYVRSLARVAVRACRRPARWPCALYSVTGPADPRANETARTGQAAS